MKKSLIISSSVLAGIIAVVSCKKKFDTPPLKTPNEGAAITIASVKSRIATQPSYKFTSGDTSLNCTVIADETSGNIFKQVFVKDDAGGAIQVNLLDPGGLSVGDNIRINLNGIYVVSANNMIYLDSVNLGNSIVKKSSGNPVTPIVVNSISSINSSLQSQLVTINNVEFASVDKGKQYADPIGKSSVNRSLVPCGSGAPVLVVRSSGYASFAGVLTPTGGGAVTAIVTQFGSTMQFTIRNINEVQLNTASCSATTTPTLSPGTYLLKDFEDNSTTSSGWTNVNVTASVNWAVATATSSNSKVGQCNNFLGSGNQPACETWFISPSVNLSTSTAPSFSFTSAGNTFSGPPLEVWISTNYTGGLPSTAVWTQLTPTLGGNNTTFVPSGLISLNSYKVNNVRVAFKYVGSLNSGRRWQIDDIRIGE